MPSCPMYAAIGKVNLDCLSRRKMDGWMIYLISSASSFPVLKLWVQKKKKKNKSKVRRSLWASGSLREPFYKTKK